MGVVVVAEDDPDIRELITTELECTGHHVTATGDGAAAILAIRQQLPDAVVLDLQMPGLSGLDVCRLMRVDPSTARIPVAIVTAHSQPQYVGESYNSGADKFLGKPFTLEELTETVDALIAAGQRTTPTGPGSAVAGPGRTDTVARPVSRRGFYQSLLESNQQPNTP